MNRETWNNSWPLERMLFALAGTVLLISIILTLAVSQWFLLLTAFVALNQLLFATAGFCGASLLLSRVAGVQPACAKAGAR